MLACCQRCLTLVLVGLLNESHVQEIVFLRCQGACLASLRPEYLMTLDDFKVWHYLHSSDAVSNDVGLGTTGEMMQDDMFEAVSLRAWTDILLQIYKVCG